MVALFLPAAATADLCLAPIDITLEGGANSQSPQRSVNMTRAGELKDLESYRPEQQSSKTYRPEQQSSKIIHRHHFLKWSDWQHTELAFPSMLAAVNLHLVSDMPSSQAFFMRLLNIPWEIPADVLWTICATMEPPVLVHSIKYANRGSNSRIAEITVADVLSAVSLIMNLHGRFCCQPKTDATGLLVQSLQWPWRDPTTEILREQLNLPLLVCPGSVLLPLIMARPQLRYRPDLIILVWATMHQSEHLECAVPSQWFLSAPDLNPSGKHGGTLWQGNAGYLELGSQQHFPYIKTIKSLAEYRKAMVLKHLPGLMSTWPGPQCFQ